LISNGQDSNSKDCYNIKAGYSRYVSNVISNNKHVYYNNFKLELNYEILNHVDAGLYVGYSKFQTTKYNLSDTTWVHSKQPTLFYGISCNYHLLPILMKKEGCCDIYITGKLGGYYVNSRNGFVPIGNDYEYAIGIGVAFYIFKHVGVFSEYTYGKYYYKDHDNLKCGISLKF
jgi:hypothetical protein